MSNLTQYKLFNGDDKNNTPFGVTFSFNFHWLVHSNFPRASRMHGTRPMVSFIHFCEIMRKPRPHHVTINLWQQDILYHAVFKWCSLRRSSVKLTKLLVGCLNAPWKSFYVNLPFERLAFLIPFVTFWKLIRVTLLLHADWMMLKNASNQGGANSVTVATFWHTKSRPQMLVTSKATFLENYLAVSTWILNWSSI